MNYTMLYSGPLLFRTKLSNSDIKKIYSLCIKNKKNLIQDKLAGLIKDEYQIMNNKKLQDIIQPYLESFQEAYFNWYVQKFGRVEVHAAWVNYMKAGESNPPHIHNDCDFSSVLYLDLPKGLKKESQEYINMGTKPGEICFTFSAPINNYICSHSVLPEVGDFYIFPASLLHSVNPFKSKGERVSVAINFKLYR